MVVEEGDRGFTQSGKAMASGHRAHVAQAFKPARQLDEPIPRPRVVGVCGVDALPSAGGTREIAAVRQGVRPFEAVEGVTRSAVQVLRGRGGTESERLEDRVLGCHQPQSIQERVRIPEAAICHEELGKERSRGDIFGGRADHLFQNRYAKRAIAGFEVQASENDVGCRMVRMMAQPGTKHAQRLYALARPSQRIGERHERQRPRVVPHALA